MCCTRSPACVPALKSRPPFGLGEHCRYPARSMSFTIRTLMLLTTWVAWCIFAVLSGRAWAYDATEVTGWLLVSLTLPLAFTSAPESRGFWSTYSCTAAVFLILAAMGNEAFVSITNTIGCRIVDLYVSIFGNGEGLSNAYLKTNILGIIVRLHFVPLMALVAAFLHRTIIIDRSNAG